MIAVQEGETSDLLLTFLSIFVSNTFLCFYILALGDCSKFLIAAL